MKKLLLFQVECAILQKYTNRILYMLSNVSGIPAYAGGRSAQRFFTKETPHKGFAQDMPAVFPWMPSGLWADGDGGNVRRGEES